MRAVNAKRRSALAPLALVAALGGCDATLALDNPPNAPTSSPPTASHGEASAGASAAPTSVAAPLPAAAGGMWLFNDFPTERVKKQFGFTATKEWLDHVRLSSVRLAGGCSGSVVSPSGLVMTNHHCAERCIEQLSTGKKDFVKAGFYAKTDKDEVKCPEIEANQLVEITDVTAQVEGATKGKSGAEFNDAQKAEMSRLEKACATSDKVRCDVVSLYHGGRYHLYKYKRFQDVRLVFAPEQSIAFFGGDPDNFMFPRYDLDVSFLRIYEDDKPAKAEHFLAWSRDGAKAGDLAFTSGHPARTSRELTVAQLEYMRDVSLPALLLRLSFERGMLTQYSARGAEQARVAKGALFYVENAIKALKNQHAALGDPAVVHAKVAEERALRAWVDADPRRKAAWGAAWSTIEKAQAQARILREAYSTIEQGHGFESDLFERARGLVRLAEEKTKPNDQRLREYIDSKLPALKQRLLSTAPVYDEFETLKLASSLTYLREQLGTDHPFVKKVLGKETPGDVAARLVKGSKLGDPKVRKELFEGGQATIDASKDTMIVFAKLVDADARAIRKAYEDTVEAPVKTASELTAKARFAAYGTAQAPDATFTLRLSVGVVKGWDEGGKAVDPITTFGGAFDRATGKDPYALPDSWLSAKSKLDLATPFNFCTTNDIVGGNSGSPVVNQRGEVVGLVFDGNIHSLGGDYLFDETKNRAVAVHSRALTHALDKVYGAARILGELSPAK